MYSKRLLVTAARAWNGFKTPYADTKLLVEGPRFTSRKRWYQHLIHAADTVDQKQLLNASLRYFIQACGRHDLDLILAAVAYCKQHPTVFEDDENFSAGRFYLLGSVLKKTYAYEVRTEMMNQHAVAYQRQAFRMLHAGKLHAKITAEFRDIEVWRSFLVEAAIYGFHDQLVYDAWYTTQNDCKMSFADYKEQIQTYRTQLLRNYWMPATMLPSEFAEANQLTDDLLFALYPTHPFNYALRYIAALHFNNDPAARELLSQPHYIVLNGTDVPQVAHQLPLEYKLAVQYAAAG